MPIKQVTCSICKQIVNKAITYSVGKDERACRSHEGVVEKKDQQILQLKKKAEMETQKQEHKRSESWGTPPPTTFGPKCWVCLNDGIRQDEFFQRVLIEREKARMLYGTWNPFDPTHPGNKIVIGRCIFVLAKEKCTNAMKYIREEFAQLIQMTSVVAICAQCCHNLGVEPLADRPQPTLEQMTMLGVVYETHIAPIVQEIAKKEMTRDN